MSATSRSRTTNRSSSRARLRQSEDDDWQHEDTFFVPPKNIESDASYVHIIDLVRSEHAWPVRAHIELTIDNNRL
jgi:hypothetical protein